MLTEGGVQFVQNAAEACLVVVKLIDKECAGQSCILGCIPSQLGSNLNACLAVHQDHGTVRHAERLRDLTREIQVTGRVDDVDLDVLPDHRSHCRGD